MAAGRVLVATATDLRRPVALAVSGGRSTPTAARGRSPSASCQSRTGWEPIVLERTLGRRWRKDTPGFWDRLSPLGADSTPVPSTPVSEPVSGGGAVDLRLVGINGSMDDPDANDNEEGEEVVSW